MVEGHKGIATDVHTEIRVVLSGRTERNQHPGYEWATCAVCGGEFERGKGWGPGEGPTECADFNCGKAAV